MAYETPYLSGFFSFFNDHGIRYCVMNNYTEYPDSIPSDIDIIVSQETFDSLDHLMHSYSLLYKLPIIQKIWHGHNKCAYILSPVRISGRFRLQLDFFVNFTAKHYYKLIPAELVLSTSRTYRSFPIPDIHVEVVFLVMRRIIKNDMTEEKLREITDLMDSPAFSEHSLENLFCNTILNICRNVRDGSADEFSATSCEYRKSLRRYSKSISSIAYRASYYVTEMHRLYNRITNRVGLSVCFLGPDGAGKSTVIRGVIDLLDGSFHGAKSLYWRPRLFPAMGRFKLWAPSSEITTNPNPHGHSRQHPIKSIARFMYYYFDFVIGYLLKTTPMLIRKNLVCFDRYYYDYLVDLHRYRMNIPEWLPRMFLPTIPAPDVVIILLASPEIMISRKQELSFDELTRQYQEYRRISDLLPNCRVVDSGRPLPEICKDIAEIALTIKSSFVGQAIRSRA